MNKIKETGEYSMSLDLQVEAELAQLKKDAKRYRWLRQFGDPNFDPGECPDEPKSPEELDALVDAAIIKTGFEKV